MTIGFTPSEHSEEVFTAIDTVDGSAYFSEPSSQSPIEIKTEQRTSISYLSWAISAVAIGFYGAYLAMPTESSFEAIYTRYLAKEEPRARVFEEGVKLRFDREAPPIAALEEALRDQPWATIERSPGLSVKATELKAETQSVEKLAGRIIADNQRVWAEIRAARPVVAPAVIEHRQALSTAALSSVRALPAAPTERFVNPPVVISAAKLGMTRDQILASLFMPIANQKNVNWNQPSARTAERAIAQTPPRPVAVSPTESPLTMGLTDGPVGRVAPQGRQILVRGPIEFSGGLAVTHAGDRLVVQREAEGRSAEAGSVSLRDAHYEIYVESLDGLLVAELRAPHGEIVGRGHFELSKIQVTPDQRRVDGVLLKVTPVVTGVAGRVRSAYATGPMDHGIRGARIAVPQTAIKTQSQGGGFFEEHRLAEGSRVVARVNAKEHRPTIATLLTGKESIVPMYSDKMISAFEGLTREQVVANQGLIWGRVVRNGSPVPGARVEVLTEGAMKPIYFSELMLPDKSTTMTASNGLFAIPIVEGQVHAIQIVSGEKYSEPVFAVVDAGAVAPLELDLAMRSVYSARAFDAFRTEWPLAVDVRPTGHAKNRTIRLLREATAERPHRVGLTHLGHPVSLDVEAGPEYLRTRVIQNPDTRYLIMPMVQKAWFDRLVGRVRYNAAMSDGAAIGFIQGARFKVEVAAESLGADARIIYFDSRGEILEQPYGEAGGGFVILGLKSGMQTIVVKADGSDQVFASTLMIEHDTVATVNHWLR
ncbi:MAG: hypothetical protein JNJ49_02565 [Bdellovibrionaceae bacterium]|nr:hypothetical protein [Pseudobdellovibrionaceae bacterium]